MCVFGQISEIPGGNGDMRKNMNNDIKIKDGFQIDSRVKLVDIKYILL